VDLGTRLPGVETLTTGRPLFFDSMEQLTAAYPGIALDATEGARAFLPLIASGRAVGSCILGFDRPRGFSTEERTVLTALAGLIAHAMEKAQRYESEAALARGLQQALLPRRLSAHPQLETAGRYLPGTAGMEVGGDWYDVVESGDGLALVIGDVQGHGVQAAATMGQLRSAVRAFALGDRPPDEVMSSTNHLLIDLDPGLFAGLNQCHRRVNVDDHSVDVYFAQIRHVAPSVFAGTDAPLEGLLARLTSRFQTGVGKLSCRQGRLPESFGRLSVDRRVASPQQSSPRSRASPQHRAIPGRRAEHPWPPCF
jgi:hypothetical protein